MGSSNLFFESVFKRAVSDAGTQAYLTEITQQHPYFSPAQFYLLLQAEKGTNEYKKIAAKTAILFNNPYWLQFQLEEQQEIHSTNTPALNDLDEPVVNETVDERNDQPATISPEGSLISTPTVVQELTHDDTAGEIPGKIVQPANETGEQPAFRNVSAPTSPALSVDDEWLPMDTRETSFDTAVDFSPAPVGKGGVESDDPKEPPDEEVKAPVVSKQEEKNAPLAHTHFYTDKEPLVNETDTEEVPLTEDQTEPLNFKLNIDTSSTTEETIAFEPLHTTDYFASLGIRLSGEIKPTDKLGKQLKSFTDWLKTMKKIHGEQVSPQAAPSDTSIQQLAEQSNKEDAVLTEAMADVLLQQGKTAKAIEVYKKLSLFNPSKSAYFAAKIDQLKH